MSFLNKNKFLNDAERANLETSLKCFWQNSDCDEFRDALLIMLVLKTGARASEALNIVKGDLNAYDKSVLIKGLKNSNDREIPLAPQFFQKLMEYAQGAEKDSDKIFDISYKRLFQIWKQYRTAKKGIHSLRHTFALRLYRKTKDIRVVQQALGHRSINSTLVYQTYEYNIRELRKAIL